MVDIRMCRRLLLILGIWSSVLPLIAQGLTPRQVLDKTAALVGNRGGASANFVLTDSKMGKTTGSLLLKGDKFCARTSQAVVWFDGKTQWSYLKNTNEVSVTTPNENQRSSMNPYTFINMYKNGYSLSMKIVGGAYHVTLKSVVKKSIDEMLIIVSKNNFVPHAMKVKRNGQWLTISISKFTKKNLSDGLFSFNSKELPDAEIIDLR